MGVVSRYSFVNWLEISGTLMGLLYLYWEYKASPWLWLASIAMPAIYLGVYYSAGLYADFAISIYYIVASIYGLVVWLTHGDKSTEEYNSSSGIRHTPTSKILLLSLTAAALTIALGLLLSRFTDSTVPWGDALTTALSVVALWMLAKKYIEQWWVWCVADLAYTGLYFYKELWFTAVLYLLYAMVAVFGYYKWKKLMKK